MPESPPRYEFRIWDDDLAIVKDRLARLGARDRSIESTELYLVPTKTERCNAKIRSGLLDVKRLLLETRGLQQWTPILKAPFPLDTHRFAACLDCLGAGSLTPSRSTYSEGEFIGELAAARLIVLAAISKQREVFQLDECIAEFTVVTVTSLGDAQRHTVAIESSDVDRVIALAAKLDIFRYSNRSYVQELRRLMHLVDLKN
jgi:exopolyphosphatase/guanosine-5'-triphosphate,3'-diphosphate pyrophosphatase